MQSSPGAKAEPRSQRIAAGGSSASQRPAAIASRAASQVRRLVAATVSWRSADQLSSSTCGSKASARQATKMERIKLARPGAV